jgi:hypothetical protein
VQNANRLDPGLFTGAKTALSLWLFHPYVQHGKPQVFQADITFHVK